MRLGVVMKQTRLTGRAGDIRPQAHWVQIGSLDIDQRIVKRGHAFSLPLAYPLVTTMPRAGDVPTKADTSIDLKIVEFMLEAGGGPLLAIVAAARDVKKLPYVPGWHADRR